MRLDKTIKEISKIQKELKDELDSASYNGSFAGQVIVSEKTKILERIVAAILADQKA